MLFGYFILFVALVIEAVGAYYSVTGLAAIFSGALVPIIIMGGSLEIGKVTAAVWLKLYWDRVSTTYKLYLVPAVAFLMVLTSMGIFGFLSKAHSDQSLVSGDSQAKVAIYDEKIKTAKENIESDRKQLQQMDEAVDQVMARSQDEKGADKANVIRKSQQRDRSALAKDIEANQKLIISLNDEAAPIRAESRKIEADVGPIKYIAAFIYGDNPDSNVLERAVRWVIILIVAVFDPLALVLILAAQQTLRWDQEDKEEGNNPPGPKETLSPTVADSEIEDPHNIAEKSIELNKEPLEEIAPSEPVTEVVPEAVYVEPEIDIEHVNQLLDEAKPEPEVELPEPEPVDEFPHRGKGPMPYVPMTASYQTYTVPKEPEVLPTQHTEQINEVPRELVFTPASAEDANNLLDVIKEAAGFKSPNAPGMDASIERPGDYLPEKTPVPETGRARNRGKIYADNSPTLPDKSVHSDFGNEFPTAPSKGDTYLRTDYLPNRLFKFNGQKWMEVDKSNTDVYAYEEEYIKHLINEIDAGRYDLDTLTDTEREQIQKYLEK